MICNHHLVSTHVDSLFGFQALEPVSAVRVSIYATGWRFDAILYFPIAIVSSTSHFLFCGSHDSNQRKFCVGTQMSECTYCSYIYCFVRATCTLTISLITVDATSPVFSVGCGIKNEP